MHKRRRNRSVCPKGRAEHPDRADRRRRLRLADTFGGVVHTPTLSRLRERRHQLQPFHTTSICSPTRAALLTGRNHQRVGSGTIAERAVDWDGYTGVIPKTSATIAEVLQNYGYKTSAFGKWHNTPADQTTAMGPFDRWPTGLRLRLLLRLPRRRNLAVGTAARREHDADRAAARREVSPDRGHGGQGARLAEEAPRLLAGQAVPHVLGARRGARPAPCRKEWADKYKGKFDDGWDKLSRGRLRAPEGARLDSGRHEAHAARRNDGRVGQHPGSGARRSSAG